MILEKHVSLLSSAKEAVTERNVLPNTRPMKIESFLNITFPLNPIPQIALNLFLTSSLIKN
jgi:hypothetical protein